MLTRRSVMVRLGLCLVLGAVTTWLVAWAIAAGEQLDQVQMVLEEDGLREGVAVSGPYLAWLEAWPNQGVRQWMVGRTDTDGPALLAFRRAAEQIRTVGVEQFARTLSEGDDAGWSAAKRADKEASSFATSPVGSLAGSREWFQVAEISFGWPARCLSGADVTDLLPAQASTPLATSYWQIVVPWPRGSGSPGTPTGLILPTHPIRSGLLLNTAFYGALWALPLFGFPLLKQARRRGKGRCPRCAYDLKRDLEQGCPECGWRRQGGA